MAAIKEFREFFLRHLKVTSGAKPDQEVNFPTQYQLGANTVFNRFLANDYPQESVFKKLFESLTFKLNVEDTATTTTQGLSRLATDDEAKNFANNSGLSFVNVVRPSQLPTLRSSTIVFPDVLETTITNEGIIIKKIKTFTGALFQAGYSIQAKVGGSITIGGANELQLEGDAVTPGGNKYYGTNAVGDKAFYTTPNSVLSGSIILWVGAVPTGYFLCDGNNGTPNLVADQIGATVFIMKS